MKDGKISQLEKWFFSPERFKGSIKLRTSWVNNFMSKHTYKSM